jgi:hypothetical protein
MEDPRVEGIGFKRSKTVTFGLKGLEDEGHCCL